MGRMLMFAYGVLCYFMFLAVFAYAMGFVANAFVPKSIDSGPAPETWLAAVINAGLLLVFGVQHSVMARPSFKRWWTRLVPQPIERSTYVLASNVALIALFVLWQPMPTLIWNVEHGVARAALWGLFVVGWLTVPLTTLLINHFDLFGLRQVWLHLQGRPYTSLKFKTPGPYRWIRHPLYVGWIIAFWATPSMSQGHMLFAVINTAYILLAIVLEERNLVEHFGQDYIDYRDRTGKLLPRLRPVAVAPAEPLISMDSSSVGARSR